MKKGVVLGIVLLLAGTAWAAEAGFGFTVDNVSIVAQGRYFIGEMTNTTSDAYKIVKFKIALLDGEGKLLWVDLFYVSNILAGQTKAFRVMMSEAPLAQVKQWRVEYENGYKLR